MGSSAMTLGCETERGRRRRYATYRRIMKRMMLVGEEIRGTTVAARLGKGNVEVGKGGRAERGVAGDWEVVVIAVSRFLGSG